jgi:hypothetical protein
MKNESRPKIDDGTASTSWYRLLERLEPSPPGAARADEPRAVLLEQLEVDARLRKKPSRMCDATFDEVRSPASTRRAA